MVDSRLALMQLSDSFFPSGSFTLSHGLESLVQTNQIRTTKDVETFLHLLLHNKVGCSDLVALIHAYRASVANDFSEIQRADACLYAQTLIHSTREAQRRSGQALLMVARSTWNDPQLESLQNAIDAQQMIGLHPIAFAIVVVPFISARATPVLLFSIALSRGLWEPPFAWVFWGTWAHRLFFIQWQQKLRRSCSKPQLL